MAATPYLHVVYAGRGDAMLLEYTENGTRRLVLIDGGPLNKKNMSEPAPYWKYYFSAARRIWEQMHAPGPVPMFKPDAIINSHADEDHYGGLLKLFQTSLISANPSMDFDGPFLMPSVRKVKTAQKKRKRNTGGPWVEPAKKPNLNLAWQEFSKALVRKQGFVENRGFAVPGLISDYPPPDEIAFFAAPAVPAPLPKTVRPTITDFNPESILMRTNLNAGVKEMYYTGDSNGEATHPFVNGKEYSIYKVQHHGSRFDNAYPYVNFGLSIAVIRELNLYAICEAGETPAASPIDFNESVPYGFNSDGLRYCYTIALAELNRLRAPLPPIAVGSQDAKDFLFALKLRWMSYSSLAQGPNNITLLRQGHNTAALPMGQFPNDIMEVVEKRIRKMDGALPECHYFYDSGNFMAGVKATKFGEKKWWSRFLEGKSLQPYMARWRDTEAISTYFSLFKADAYVISANSEHGHPNPATIVGMAHGVAKWLPANTKATLYMTFGFAGHPAPYLNLAREIGIFVEDHLDIRCLSPFATDTFMTLDGGAGAVPSRDVHNRTTAVDLHANQTIYTDLKKTLQADPTIVYIPDVAELSRRDWTVQPVHPKNNKLYLQLKGAGDPEVVQSANEILGKVVEGWMSGLGGSSNISITQVINHAQVTLAATVGSRSAAKKDRGRELFFTSGGVVRTFYWKDKPKFVAEVDSVAAITAMVPPPERVVFEIVEFPRPPRLFAAFVNLDAAPSNLRSLKTYATMAGITLGPSWTLLEALEAITSAKTVKDLDYSMVYQSIFINLQVDPDASMVDFLSDDINVDVRSASLVSKASPVGAIMLESESLVSSSVDLEITTEEDESISAKLTVKFPNGLSIASNKTAPKVSRLASLGRLLTTMNVTKAEMDTLLVPKLLGLLLKDTQKADNIFTQNLPAIFVKSGLAGLKPDYQLSSADAEMTAITDTVFIHKAKIVCATKNVSLWDSDLSVVGVDMKMQDCCFNVSEASSPQEYIEFRAVAAFQTQGVTHLKLEVSSELKGDYTADIVVTVSGTDSISELSKALPGTPDFLKMAIPLTKGNSPLSTLKTTKLGFSIGQNTTQQINYTLKSVFASTTLNDWLQFLPASFPTAVEDVRAGIKIVNPLKSDLRAVAVSVGFSLRVSEKLLDLDFHAEPLGRPGEYEYRLTVYSSNTGISVVDVTNAVKLGDPTQQIENSIPLLANVLKAVHVRQLSLAVEQQSSKRVYADWSLNLWIDKIVIIAGIVTVENASIEVGHTADNFDCNIAAVFSIGSSEEYVGVELTTPSQGIPGVFRIASPSGISTADLMKAFSLPDLTSVPILGTLLSIRLKEAEMTFGSLPAATTLTKCFGAYCEFALDSLEIGVLKLENLRFAVEYHSVDDPCGLGAEQTLFSIEAAFFDGSLTAMVSYDTLDKELRAVLKPIKTCKVKDMLAIVLPTGIINTLDPIIGDLEVVYAALTLDTGEKKAITSFQLELADKSTVPVKGLILKSLTVDYQAAQTVPEALPAQLNVTGVAAKGNSTCLVTIGCIEKSGTNAGTVSVSITPEEGSTLSLTEFLSVFSFDKPTYDEPNGSPTFFDLQVIDITGVFKLPSGTKDLKVQTLNATARSDGHLVIYDDGVDAANSVALDQVSLNVHYDGVTDKITGYVSAHLKVAKFDVWCRYAKDANEEKFSGLLTIAELDGLSLENLAAAIKLPAPKYRYPLEVPSNLKLAALSVVFVRGKSVEISGVGAVTWDSQCSGVVLKSSNLGALLRISKPPQGVPAGTKNIYEIYITGTLNFFGFTSATMKLNIASGQPVILEAMLVKSAGIENQLAALSKEVDSSKAIDQLWPTDTSSLTFDAQKGLWVTADLTNKKIVVAGTIANVGNALLLAKSNDGNTGNSYFFSMSASNLKTLWPALDEGAFKKFDTETICAEVVSYDGTIKDLQDDVNALVPVVDADKTKLLGGLSPLTTLPDTEKLTPGVWLFAVISIVNGAPMSDALALAADPVKPATVTLWALITKAPSSRTYGIRIQNLYLLGSSMLLEGTGSYLSDKEEISVTARLDVYNITNTTLEFMVDLQIKPNATFFSLSTKAVSKTTTISRSDMFNVELSQLQFDVNITKNGSKVTRIYTLKGAVRLGSDTTVDNTLHGQIMFKDGTPKVISVTWQANLGIQDLYNKIIRPGSSDAGEWPSDYDPITLEQVSLYYVAGKDNVDIDTIKYVAGYHAAAKLSILEKLFSVTLDIPANRQGFVLSGSYLGDQGVIDLDFLQFTRYTKDGVSTGGPTIAIDTMKKNSTIYKLLAGITLFGHTGLNLDIGYNTSEKALEGEINYEGELLGETNPKIKVRYKDGKFEIVDWPLLKVGAELMDLAQAIMDASSGDSSCGELVNLVFDKVITNKFNLHAAISKEKSSDPNVKSVSIDITGTYNVYVYDHDPSREICSVDIPKLTLSLVGPFSMDNFGTALGNTIKKNAKDIAHNLLKEKGQLAKLMAVMGVQALSKEVISRLICRGVDSDNVEDEAENDANADTDAVEADVATGEAGAATAAAGGGIEAAAGGVAAALAALGLAAGGIAGLADSKNVRNRLEALPPPQDPAKAKARAERIQKLKDKARDCQTNYDNAVKATEAARQAICDAIVLDSVPAAAFVNPTDVSDDTVMVDWSKVLPKDGKYTFGNFESFTWECEFSITQAPNLPTGKTTPTVNKYASSKDPQYTFAPDVYAWIRGTYTKDNLAFVGSKWTFVKVSHKPWLTSPENIQLLANQKRNTIDCIVSSQKTIISKCQVSLKILDANSKEQLVVLPSETTRTSNTFSYPVDKFPSITRTIVATAEYLPNDDALATQHGSAKITTSNSIKAIAPPSDLTAEMSDESIKAKWNQPNAAVYDYLVRILRGETEIFVSECQSTASVNFETVISPPKNLLFETEQVTIEICATKLPADTVALHSRVPLTISFPPVVFIQDDQSWFNQSSTEILLFAKLKNPAVAGSSAVLRVTWPDGQSVSNIPVDTTDFEDLAVTITTRSDTVLKPMPKELQLAIVEPNGRMTAYSRPWELKDTMARLPDVSIAATGKEIIVHYTVENPSASSDMMISLTNPDTGNPIVRTVNSTIHDPVVFGPADFKYTPNTQLQLRFQSRTLGLRGDHETMRFVLPDDHLLGRSGVEQNIDHWSEPQVMTESTMDIFPSHIGTPNLVMWCWSDERNRVLLNYAEGSRRSVGVSGTNTTGHFVRFIETSIQNTAFMMHTSEEGECRVYKLTRDMPMYEQIFAANGLATAGGGAAASLKRSAANDIFDLFMVDENGDISTIAVDPTKGAISTRTTITGASVAIGSEGVPAIAAVSLIDDQQEVYWVDDQGVVRCAVGSAGKNDWRVTNITIRNDAAIFGGVHALALPGIGTRTWWTTRNGGVNSAFRPDVHVDSGFTYPTGIVQVAPPGSANPRSVIASMPPNPAHPLGDQPLSVFWYSNDGALCGAKISSAATASPTWCFYDQIAKGGARVKGVRALATYRWSGSKYLSFVNQNNLASFVVWDDD